MKRLELAILAALVVPGLALAQHQHGGGMKETGASPPRDPSSSSSSSSSSSGAGRQGGTASSLSGDPVPETAGFHMGVELDHAVGSGTFVDSRYYALFGGSLVLSPKYSFTVRDVKLAASAKATLDWEYTSADNDTGRQVSYSDMRLGLAAPGIFKEKATGISLSPNFGLSIPISPESRVASTITSLSLGAGLARSFGKLELMYRLGVGRGIHGSGQILTSRSDRRDELGNLIFICRTDEAYCGTMGNNTAWSLSNSLSATYHPLEKLSVALSYGISSSWKYGVTDAVDDITPKKVDSELNPVARVGMFRAADKTTASLGASYALSDNLELALGMATAGPAKTMDGKRFRFPFYDFVGPASSLTTYSLTLSASY